MDGPRGYYAEGNKSDIEIQILSGFTYMWNLKNIIYGKKALHIGSYKIEDIKYSIGNIVHNIMLMTAMS